MLYWKSISVRIYGLIYPDERPNPVFYSCITKAQHSSYLDNTLLPRRYSPVYCSHPPTGTGDKLITYATIHYWFTTIVWPSKSRSHTEIITYITPYAINATDVCKFWEAIFDFGLGCNGFPYTYYIKFYQMALHEAFSGSMVSFKLSLSFSVPYRTRILPIRVWAIPYGLVYFTERNGTISRNGTEQFHGTF